MSALERIDIEISDKPYNISTISILYFAFYTSFQRHFEQAVDKHGDISLFDAAYRGVESDFRHCFRMLGIDLTKYNILCNTLNLLCIDTLEERFMNAII